MKKRKYFPDRERRDEGGTWWAGGIINVGVFVTVDGAYSLPRGKFLTVVSGVSLISRICWCTHNNFIYLPLDLGKCLSDLNDKRLRRQV